MTSDHWQRIRDVFEAAKEMAPTDRVSYLAEACRDDELVRAEVQALIVASEAAGDFIESPAMSKVAGLSTDGLLTSAAGRRLGSYEIVREIGRGGMGVVYLAVRADDEYHRRVAIKLAWPGQESREMLRRFRQERQILANLDHPNIARLLDGGTTDERLPYVVMEYIDGAPITDYCDLHKLNVTQRLELYLTVCAAAAYAHRNLVIHRDIKPTNILVTEDGTLKLLDFGIAKLLIPADQVDPTALTGTGLRLMTPAYASPEQMRGEAITTVSDVYSLGVVLYELLTGHRPYRFKNRLLPEMERVISEQEPERPSAMINRVVTETTSDGAPLKQRTPESVSLPREGRPEKLRGRLAGDLDNILLMALRKNVQQRYQSVERRYSPSLARRERRCPPANDGLSRGQIRPAASGGSRRERDLDSDIDQRDCCDFLAGTQGDRTSADQPAVTLCGADEPGGAGMGDYEHRSPEGFGGEPMAATGRGRFAWFRMVLPLAALQSERHTLQPAALEGSLVGRVFAGRRKVGRRR